MSPKKQKKRTIILNKTFENHITYKLDNDIF